MDHLTLAPLLITTILAADFALEFEGPSRLGVTSPGSLWNASYDCVLESSGDGPGVEAWSISLTADRARITEITLEGTDADTLRPFGYVKSELTASGTGECSGQVGAVSAVVLALLDGVTLPRPGSATIAKVRVEGTVPEGGGSAELRYVDGCQGSGQPVANVVSVNASSVAPARSALNVALALTNQCCDKQVNVGFSLSNLSSSSPYDRIIDDGSGLCTGGGGTMQLVGRPGEAPSGELFAVVSSIQAGLGVQGWAIAVELEGDIDFRGRGITTAGTAVDAYFFGGFKKSELFDSSKNGGRRGAWSFVVLSFGPVTFPPTGTESIANLAVGPADSVELADQAGRIVFRDGLIGTTNPVTNFFNVDGRDIGPCNVSTAEITVVLKRCALPIPGHFIRGNANDDARVDISDAVFTLSWLALGGPPSRCEEWADANGDYRVDISDPIYTLSFLFSGGPPPREPFRGCGADPSAAACVQPSCAETQAACN